MALITLKKTCGECPEQYDAYMGDRQIGYLRLRHGHFTVQAGDVDGKVVYETSDFCGDGKFEIDEERNAHLRKACRALWEYQLFEIVDAYSGKVIG